MRRLLQFLFVVLIASWVWALQVPAYGQSLRCPAGGEGGPGGSGGVSLGGLGGTAQPGFATGGDGGEADGGRGGAGGSGTLPICNQNTNGLVAGSEGMSSAPADAVASLGPVGSPLTTTVGSGAGLGRTGAWTNAELGMAGVAFVIGGSFLFVVQPRRRRAAETFTEEVEGHEALPDPDEMWLAHALTRSTHDPAAAHARRMARAVRRQSIPRRAAVPDPYPHVDAVVTKLREAERVA